MSDDPYGWLDEFLATKKPPTSAPRPALPGPPSNGQTDSYGKAALNGELEKLLGASEGGRNEQLNTSAFKLGQLVATGHLDEAEVVTELSNAAAGIGLSDSEIPGTVRSGMTSGQRWPREPEPLPVNVTEVSSDELGVAAEGTSDEPRERTSWWPRPIGERASEAAEAPLPTYLTREDGNCLCYAGKVNGLIGESESGKSWVAMLAVLQAVRRGERVLFLDFEDSPASVHYRLGTNLELTTVELELIDYADPQESLALEQRVDLEEALGKNYGLIVVDGVNAVMVLLDYDLNSNTDATKLFRRLLRPLARTGACVITVDHLPKNPDARGKGGIGAQAKRAMTDGCLLTAEVSEPFGRGQSGSVKLVVDKDRNGRVRGISMGGKKAGVMQVVSISDVVQLSIEAPEMTVSESGELKGWRPTEVMEKVARVLEVAGEPLSFHSIELQVDARQATIREAVRALHLDGLITIEPGPRGAKMHSLQRPHPTPSHPIPDTVSATPSRVSPTTPSKGGRYPDGVSGVDDALEALNPRDTVSELELEMSAGHSACNRCGDPTPDEIIEETAGYCRRCGRIMNP